ncbi:MAG: preprotein translocase subunit SecD [Oceanotoga sp.]|uniref:protein translocase subunit SecD n=1 Tax=Oceanotoga sp. TaxID=2108366 RepID=UPI00264FA35B|nr:protein translocase subunit SecD [Oceanotoga sp.]MDN5341174.1 preprotein translocase subunit SecD [Oceanotoga sp.]
MRSNKVRLIFTIAVIVVALLGMLIPGKNAAEYSGFGKLFSNLKLGLDIQGGSLFEYNLDLKGDVKAQDVIDNVILVLRNRLDAAGYTEATVARIDSGGNLRVRVEIPGIRDTQEAEKLLGSKGKLYFAEVLETSTTDVKPELRRNREIEINGSTIELYSWIQSKRNDTTWYKVKNVFEFGREPFEITGSDVIDAKPGLNTRGSGAVVHLNFSSAGSTKFELATGNLINKQLAIILDDKVIIAPVVNTKITQGGAEIEGIQEIQEAKNIAALIKSGNLPVDLVKFQERTLGPTLGRDIVDTIIKAGIIGLAIVMIYMIIFYGWMGVIADIALIYNTILLTGILSWTNAILTLPGIAGIILTFGTTVDGNVIIYERIKEELRMGRPPLTSVKFGFQKAFSTLFDANLTTVIAGIILYYFSTGAVRGFAITLIIGVLGSMFTNLVVSRTILEGTSHFIKPEKFTKKGEREGWDFVGKRKGFILFSTVLIAAALILSFTKNFEYGIDFAGGTEITVSMDDSISIEDIRNDMINIDPDYATAKIVKLDPIKGQEDKFFFSVTIKDSFEDTVQKDAFIDSLSKELNQEIEILQFNDVSGFASKEIKSFAWYAIIISLVMLLAYITLRFKFAFGVGALLALAHDVIIVLGFYSLFGVEINVSAIAAFLTLAGYSLNDTIVVYDRIRENFKNLRGRPVEVIVNKSINDVIIRSLHTSITTFIVVFLMLMLGGRAMAPFAFGLTIGIVIGTYSSLYIASPIVINMLKKSKKL